MAFEADGTARIEEIRLPSTNRKYTNNETFQFIARFNGTHGSLCKPKYRSCIMELPLNHRHTWNRNWWIFIALGKGALYTNDVPY
jgi:hypothetical protein